MNKIIIDGKNLKCMLDNIANNNIYRGEIFAEDVYYNVEARIPRFLSKGYFRKWKI